MNRRDRAKMGQELVGPRQVLGGRNEKEKEKTSEHGCLRELMDLGLVELGDG